MPNEQEANEHPSAITPEPVAESEPRFTLPEVNMLITSEATGNTYRIGELIGEGNFGYVYHCSDTWQNELAVKILKPKGTYDEVKAAAIAEFEKLKLLRHPNITFVFDAFEFQHTFYIVFEKCWKSINEFIQSDGFIGQVWVRPIARQLLQAVHYIHCNQFAH